MMPNIKYFPLHKLHLYYLSLKKICSNVIAKDVDCNMYKIQGRLVE